MAHFDRQSHTGARGRAHLWWLRYLLLAVIVIVVVGGLAGGTFYEREIRFFVSQRGWNKGAAAEVVRRFITSAQNNQVDEALALVDLESYEPIVKDNTVIGLQHKEPSGMGRYKVYFNELLPAGNPQIQKVYLSTASQGGFVVSVKFGDGTQGDFMVKRVHGAYKITSVPMIEGRFHF